MGTVTDAPSLVPALPGGYYTDPAVFEAEKRRIFERSWMCVGRADAVPQPGRFLRADVGDESVLVVRGRDGEVRAFRNLCRHRGARLCTDESGTVGNSIRCVYHAWTYGLDGRLIAAPNMRRIPDLVKEDYGLHRLRAEQWQGYVWVSLDPDAPPLAAQVEPQLADRLGGPAVLDRYGIDRLGTATTIVYEVESNWKSIIENFTECYHCPTIHPELTAALPQFRSGYGSISGGGGGAGATFAEDVEGFSLSGKAARPRLPGLLAEDDRAFHGIILRPNAFIILVPDHVAFFRLEPQGPGHTRVVVDWLFDREVMAADGFDPSDAVAILDITNRQDFEACRRCQLGMRSSAYRGVLVPAEHIIGDFYSYYLDALGGPPAASQQPGSAAGSEMGAS
ncbi:aromatic ring-hydroxylating dioxygenase subunit alpha [Actinomadura sp. 7K507]|uniref:aromatic ring-hydroxylating oxygenase subunit alpha n=1 Tax=Actinomadura sp. 7K507 TaxID=2530365 RepID=UPI0010506F40|nr:aromatic ring-hydroxylating dioxygenase subunit alpha [Actinomadura sp. 7K507]TDC80529.1 aromatic ring-hydroxylating dioxygenase subunit alpha [Actinomadura sp. 7K507]